MLAEEYAFCLWTECTLDGKVQINSRTTAKNLVKILVESGTKSNKDFMDLKGHYSLQLHMRTEILFSGEMFLWPDV